jgi:hypothetical protein
VPKRKKQLADSSATIPKYKNVLADLSATVPKGKNIVAEKAASTNTVTVEPLLPHDLQWLLHN